MSLAPISTFRVGPGWRWALAWRLRFCLLVEGGGAGGNGGTAAGSAGIRTQTYGLSGAGGLGGGAFRMATKLAGSVGGIAPALTAEAGVPRILGKNIRIGHKVLDEYTNLYQKETINPGTVLVNFNNKNGEKASVQFIPTDGYAEIKQAIDYQSLKVKY